MLKGTVSKLVRDYKQNAYVKQLTVIEKETPEEFLRELDAVPYGYLGNKITDVKACSIDGIAVKPQEFHRFLREAQERRDKRRFTDVDPLHHFGFSKYESELLGLKRFGKEIVITRPPNEQAFFDKMESINEGSLLTLYHGTNGNNVPSIIMSGLRVSSSGALGRGLYVGPYEKASQFTSRRDKSKWEKKRPGNFYGTIFQLEVITGKMVHIQDIKKEKGWQKDYDTAYYTGFRNPEYCLRDASQVMIKKIILL